VFSRRRAETTVEKEEIRVMTGIDSRRLRRCFGCFATGVTVVTYRSGEATCGVTVNAFTSVSLDPPLALVSIDRKAKACALIEDNTFTVNLLGEDQNELAWQFAGRPKDGMDIVWEEGEFAPRLAGCIGWIECSPWRSYDGGDHVLHVGEVENFEVCGGEPLLFYGGKLHGLGDPTDGIPWTDSMDSPGGMGWFGTSLNLGRAVRRGRPAERT
jgi:flavin reductase